MFIHKNIVSCVRTHVISVSSPSACYVLKAPYWRVRKRNCYKIHFLYANKKRDFIRGGKKKKIAILRLFKSLETNISKERRQRKTV